VAQGFALCFTTFSTFEGLFVRPGTRGAGLGKALLSAIAAFAVARGCARLEWSVLDWNETAVGFYSRLGAEPMKGWTPMRLDGKMIQAFGARN